MRTNIVIDDHIMEKALSISGLRTKREVVEKALIDYIAVYSRKNLMDLKGKISLSDDYNYKSMREGK